MAVERQSLAVLLALVVVAFFAGFVGTYVYTEYVDTPEESVDEATIETQVIAGVNDARAEHGVGELRENGTLSEAARGHGEDMAEREFVAHENPDGESPRERVHRAELDCEAVGENVAQTWWDEPLETDDGNRLQSNDDLAAWLIEQWLASPSHRENLLDDHWTETGVAVVVENDQVFAVQKFCSIDRERHVAPERTPSLQSSDRYELTHPAASSP